MSGDPSDERSGLSFVLVTWTASVQLSKFAAGPRQLFILNRRTGHSDTEGGPPGRDPSIALRLATHLPGVTNSLVWLRQVSGNTK
jgi:hypothetical protein